MKIPTARPYSPAAIEHVRPVGTAVAGVIFCILRGLHCEYRLGAVLVIGQENVAEIREIIVFRLLYYIGILNHLIHVVFIDEVNAVGSLISVAPSEGEVAFGEVCSRSNLVYTASTIFHFHRECVVCKLEFVDYLCKKLFVAILVVGCLLLRAVLENLFIHPRNLAEHCEKFEVAVTAQEMHLTGALRRSFLAEHIYARLLKGNKGPVATRDIAVETIPKFVEFARCRCKCRPYLHRMIAGVGCSAATLEAIVGGKVAVGPQVERITVPAVAKRGVCGIDHFVGLGVGEVAVNDTGRRNVDKVVA